MLQCGIVVVTLLLASVKAATTTSTSLPRIFVGRDYGSFYKLDIPVDGKCQELSSKHGVAQGELYTNVGSITIPCKADAPAGKKYICTLYGYSGTSYCGKELVTFDHSHFDLFDNGEKLEASAAAVGGMVTGVKCKVVNASTPVKNTNNHVSTQHESICEGDPCNSDSKCPSAGGDTLYCSEQRICEAV